MFSVSAAWGTGRASPNGNTLRPKVLVVKYAEYVPLPSAYLLQRRFSQHEKPETLGLFQVRAALCTSCLVGDLVKK